MRPELERGQMGDVWFSGGRGNYVAKVYYRDYAGKRRRKMRKGTTKRQASHALKHAVKTELARTAGAGTCLTGSSSVNNALDLWLADFKQRVKAKTRSPTSFDTYRKIVDKHIRPGIGDLLIHQLDVAVLDGFLQGLAFEKSFSVAKTSRTVLSGVCGMAVRHGVLSSNPIRDVAPLERGWSERRRSLTVDEIKEWLTLLDNSSKAIRWDLPLLARLCLGTGLRIGEVLAIQWQDVDLGSGTLTVEHTIVRVTGEGLIRKRTKTSSSERDLVLPTWCLVLLKRRRKSLGDVAPETPLFPSRRGTWRDPSNTARALREVREGTDFSWVINHTHRRTLATVLDDQGVSARTIADQLGHSRPSMTQDVYMGRSKQSDVAATVLNDVLNEIASQDNEDAEF